MLSMESKPIVGGVAFFKEGKLRCAETRELASARRRPELVDRATGSINSDLVREL